MPAKIRVFVAHSFEKAIPPGQTRSDLKVAEWFVDLIRSRALGFEVITGSKGMPIRIDDKVKAGIADSAC